MVSLFLTLPLARRRRGTHAAGVARLAPHHNDPFDRLLVAQALAEPLRLLTADAALVPYGDIVLLA